MPPPPTGALSNSPIPLIRGSDTLLNRPTLQAPTHTPCPLAHPEGEKRLGHYLSASALLMGKHIFPTPIWYDYRQNETESA